MPSAQRADAANLRDLARGPAGRLKNAFPLRIDAVGERLAHRHARDAVADALRPVGDRLTPVVIDADDRGAVALDTSDEALLHRCVLGKAAVPVEVVLGDVEENADGRIDVRCKIDLKRRALDHVDAAGLRRRE